MDQKFMNDSNFIEELIRNDLSPINALKKFDHPSKSGDVPIEQPI